MKIKAGLAAWLVLAIAGSAAAQMSVTGKQVPARADAPSVTIVHSARAAYVAHCAGCHGMDGSGSQLGRVPDMRQLGQFLLLDGGREFLIKVPGVMGSGLSDHEVAQVSNWVLATLAAGTLPPGSRPYDSHEVARARQPIGGRKRSPAQARGRGAGARHPYRDGLRAI
jgi:mono/diheme cytochrome c family protein